MKYLAALLALFFIVAAASAEPVAPGERIPVDLRRTTLVVRDLDQSLRFYRDALGLTVIYDQLLGGNPDAEGGPVAPTTRLALLRANDRFIGVLGLMQRLDTPAPPVPPLAKAQAGQAILVINAADLDTRFTRIREAPGVTVFSDPKPIQYPSADGKGHIDVMFSAVWDPDGFFVEINKLLGAPAGSDAKD
ncbi:MAG: VOC family protein [Steroidobacteraceae bacterium]